MFYKTYQFCCGQSTGMLVEKTSAGMAFTAHIHTEVSPSFFLLKLRPASEKPSMLPRFFGILTSQSINAPSRIIPTNVCSHVLGPMAQAHRHNTANAQFALHD